MAVPQEVKEEKKELLKRLTYEITKEGKPIYYRGYKEVLKGKLPPEAVMGSSDLHAVLMALLVAFLAKELEKDFIVASGELGFFTGEDTYRLLDIAVFEKDKFKLTGKYTRIPPKLVIEIDTKADLEDYGLVESYAYEKTQELLDCGVEKVVWIFTKPKKVLIAEKGKKWVVQGIEEDIDLIGGEVMNLAKLTEDGSEELRKWLS